MKDEAMADEGKRRKKSKQDTGRADEAERRKNTTPDNGKITTHRLLFSTNTVVARFRHVAAIFDQHGGCYPNRLEYCSYSRVSV
ncbi:unnamed protein product [Rhodiola kirilowii]